MPLFRWEGGNRRLPLSPQPLTLADFFTVSALLSLLEVLAALGEFRPLDRISSLMGEARPSGLAGCFFRPLRSVDICSSKTKGWREWIPRPNCPPKSSHRQSRINSVFTNPLKPRHTSWGAILEMHRALRGKESADCLF